MTPTIIRRPEVLRITGVSYSTIYRLERKGNFPRRRRLGDNSVGWLLHEIEEWIHERETITTATAGAQ